MSLGSERRAVQDPLVRYAQDLSIPWKYLTPEESERLRGGCNGLLFDEILIGQLLKLNPDFMTEEIASEVAKRLQRVLPSVQGNEDAWKYFRGMKTAFVPSEKRERNVTFIDRDQLANNIFHVTDEFRFDSGRKTIRGDVMFLINGIPVLLVETKSSKGIVGISEAMAQIRRYHEQAPELLSIVQLYAVTHLLDFYYSATWNLSRKWLFNWKEESEGNFEALVKGFVDPERLIRVLQDYILFTRQDDALIKVVLRPHQMKAVDKVIKRAESEKRRGLVWHTQGSGKTFTMITAAEKILQNPAFENPTVLMLVDRNELETQLFGNLESAGIENVEVTRSKQHLRDLLAQDRRGLIVSMIHKFDDIPADINTRENFFVLVDEAHRTTGGKLGNYLMGALPNATYLGFTGTPIDKTAYGKGTFIVFGQDDPPKGYLDKYSIAESIDDGTTVELHYSLAPNHLLVDRETLEEEFLDLVDVEGLSDIDSLNKILERAVTLRNMLKNESRVRQVAEHVALHYQEHVEPMGYKAFLVAVDREACARYKEELDRLLPPEYSEVVYSPAHNDPQELRKYHLTQEEEKRVRKAFRSSAEEPKILIVTEKLLTGFDAPILYCMYLDKPMRDHVLLQAIARVNRPYEDNEGRKKPCGFVLDFVGIFDNLEKALAFDSQDIEGVVQDVQRLKERFAALIQRGKEKYLRLVTGTGDDKETEAILDYFRGREEEKQEFYQFFRELSDIYEILSPDAFLRPYLDDYDTLAAIYQILRSDFDGSLAVDRELMQKTARLVQEHTHSGKIRLSREIHEISPETLRAIESSQASETEKVFNLLKSLRRASEKDGQRIPVLVSIGERAERISELYKKRQKTTQETLEAIKKLFQEADEARRDFEQSGLSMEVFSVYWHLKQEGVTEPKEAAEEMAPVFERFSHWRSSEAHGRQVRQTLYKVLIDAGVDQKKVVETGRTILRGLERS